MMHQIDLSKDGHHLDEVFGSVLNKLPDLRMPATFRLAGENDLFNTAASIQLIPFRKQEYFDRSSRVMDAKPDFGTHNENLRSRSAEPMATQRCGTVEMATKNGIKKKADERVALVKNSYLMELEKQRRKFDRLKRARSHYSKCRMKKREQVEESGYNKLLVEPHKDEYPFEQPIPESMRTERNVDNLREIVVMESIDWKMLTPVRPNNEKEEKYFDRLVSLHRKRYEEQKKLNQQLVNIEPSFKHIRHKYSMHCCQSYKEIFVPLACRVIESTPVDRSSQSNALKDVLWDIPKLTVSGESDSIEPYSNQFRRHYKMPTGLNSSKSFQNKGKHEVSKSKGSNVVEKADLEQNESVEDLMDERIEEIVGTLMNTDLDLRENA